MRSRGLKVTRQRDQILESFLKIGKHVGVEDLLRAVRKDTPSIGNATVYRTMKLFVEAGIAEERRFSAGVTLYEPHEGDEHHHDHLICTVCERIFEFENEEIEQLQEQVADAQGFKLTHHKMELYGLCADCQS
jgi:Fur family ferric uptake transcriptional regulator